ncbi:class I SAM-dependent methyltransferase [Curtobacterium sp. 1P10AnD]|uniref:SAM-dependent methyltransferase n=1 Tax=Curtobacterium sp. 1P10AnD TaxID=3132283 RepID=UPI0039A1FC62
MSPDQSRWRRPEPSFARAVTKALGDARTVLDVAPGAVSYTPTDRETTPVEVTAGDVPFVAGAFDAAVITVDVVGCSDPERVFAEVRRVTRGPVVVVTHDPDRVQDSWLTEYAPEVTAAEARRYPALDRIATALGGAVETTRLPIPFTCVDGFSEAYYARPERLLDPGARLADPAWSAVDELTARRSVTALRDALESGEWDRRHGSLRVRPSYDGSLVLLRGMPRPA